MYVSSFNPSSELETLKTSFNFHLPSFFRFGPGLPLCLSPCTGPFFRGRSELGLLSQLVGQAYEKMLIGGFPNWFSQLVDVNWKISQCISRIVGKNPNFCHFWSRWFFDMCIPFTYVYMFTHLNLGNYFIPKNMDLYNTTDIFWSRPKNHERRKRKGRIVKDDSKLIMAFGRISCFISQPLLQLLPGNDLSGKLWWISGYGGCSSHTFTVNMIYIVYSI